MEKKYITLQVRIDDQCKNIIDQIKKDYNIKYGINLTTSQAVRIIITEYPNIKLM